MQKLYKQDLFEGLWAAGENGDGEGQSLALKRMQEGMSPKNLWMSRVVVCPGLPVRVFILSHTAAKSYRN